LSDKEIDQQLTRTNEIIFKWTEKIPVLVRPPFGKMNERVKQFIFNKGFSIIHWSLDTHDWRGISAEKIYNTVVKKLSPGDIILMHSASDSSLNGTIKALPKILRLLKENDYQMVTVDQLLGIKAYKE
jgi:peptidoglycan/xylan/chitin deacetylase (PgdA/CDA1 family)